MDKKNKSSSLILLFLIVAIVSGGLYIYTSVMFEREKPVVVLEENNGYWNLKKPLKLKIDDESGIKSYRVSVKTSAGETEMYYEKLLTPIKNVSLDISSPKSAYAMKDKSVTIIVEAQDASKWNFLSGNSVVKKFTFAIDRKRPQLSSVKHSYKIRQGGTALVVLKAIDDNLKDVYIQTNFGKKFKLEPFYKNGYYISLVAWPVTQPHFKATIVAIDKAGNKAKSYIPFYLKYKNYRISEIKLSDRFLKGKIAELADDFMETQGVEDSLEQFVIINEDVRAKNEELIHKITSKVPTKMISDFKINRMYPLKNAAPVASFGDHRKYFYNGKFISESYHLGADMASNAMASIRPQNGGEIVYSDSTGLYGNMPIIHHGLGLYTLYGHCSSVNVNSGDTIVARENIANTGKTGYAMGDHLHFGVLVQGIEVRPAEWMDKRWIKLNISNVIRDAKKIIDRN